MKVVLFGSRGWYDLPPIIDRLERIPAGTTILVGGANGADCLCEAVARMLGFKVERWLAKWDTHGKKAGIVRNQQMLDQKPALCIGFRCFNGSRGTDYMIQECARRGIACEVIEGKRF